MKKTRWMRGIALVLALVLLVGVVGALTYDLNGDGKTNVWDLQLIVNKSETDAYEAALKEAGKLRVEGKDYLVQDGDIMHIRFNV